MITVSTGDDIDGRNRTLTVIGNDVRGAEFMR